MNAGTVRSVISRAVEPVLELAWDESLSQRCNTLAFMQCELAMAAMDAPGALQAASNSALVSAE